MSDDDRDAYWLQVGDRIESLTAQLAAAEQARQLWKNRAQEADEKLAAAEQQIAALKADAESRELVFLIARLEFAAKQELVGDNARQLFADAAAEIAALKADAERYRWIRDVRDYAVICERPGDLYLRMPKELDAAIDRRIAAREAKPTSERTDQ